MICTRCLLSGEQSQEAGICQPCYEKEQDAKFSLMMRELPAADMVKTITTTCRVCGDEYEKRLDNRVLCCNKCAAEARERQVANRRNARIDDRLKNANFASEWVVQYDPIPIDEGGYDREAQIVWCPSHFSEYNHIAFVPGTILRNKNTGITITIKERTYETSA